MIWFLLIVFVLVFVPFSKPNIKGINSDYLVAKGDTQTCVNGFFILTVFVWHYINANQDCSSSLYYGFLKYITSIRQLMVTTFFFYSGFGVAQSIRTKGFSYTKSIPIKRVLKTLIIYDVAYSFYLLVCRIPLQDCSTWEIITRYLAFKPSNGSNWYFFDAMVLYFISWFSFRFYRDNLPMAATVVTLLSAVLIVVLKNYYGKPSWWYNTIACYSAGVWFAVYKERIEGILSKNVFYYITLVSLCITAYFLAIREENSIIFFYELGGICFVTAIILLTMKLEIHNPVLRWCGKNLTSIFFMHGCVFPIICPLIGNTWLRFFAATAATFALSFAFSFIIKAINLLFERINTENIAVL